MFNLEPVIPYRLGRAPLEQATAQVRFPIQAKLGTLDGVAQVQERVGERYPYLEPSQGVGVEFQFGPEGAQASFGAGGSQYVFNSDDGHSIWLAPDSATLISRDYSGIQDFAERFGELLTVLAEVARIRRCDRIAARYLNLAKPAPTDDNAWRDWFKPEFLGWSGGEVVREAVRLHSAVNQVQIVTPPSGDMSDFPADVTALVRHGLVPSGSSVAAFPPVQVQVDSYVIDFDFFCAAPQAWDSEALSSQFRALHGQMDRFFRWTLSDAGCTYFELEEVAL